MRTIVTAIAGTLLILAVLHDAFEVMLLPRRVRRRVRLVSVFFDTTWAAWSAAARRTPGRRREAALSHYGPLSMVLLLGVWAASLIVGFAALQWAMQQGHAGAPRFAQALYLSGTTLFTLGYGDVVPHTAVTKAIAVAEAATGLGLIAVIIGYLPVLYQLFSRRETLVILLDARAGSPPTATTLLVRHADREGLEALDVLLRDWERWAAELVESHLSYPMLSYYRSQHGNQSWLAALAAIMDACALLMAGLKGTRTFQARMTFAAARLAVVEIGRVFRVAPVAPVVDRLPPAEFMRVRDFLSSEGLDMVDADAEATLRAFRETYEPFLCTLADYLVLPLPRWWAAEEELDNWQRSARGKAAKVLVEAVPAQAE